MMPLTSQRQAASAKKVVVSALAAVFRLRKEGFGSSSLGDNI